MLQEEKKVGCWNLDDRNRQGGIYYLYYYISLGVLDGAEEFQELQEQKRFGALMHGYPCSGLINWPFEPLLVLLSMYIGLIDGLQNKDRLFARATSHTSLHN
jgi:hypothetical protein